MILTLYFIVAILVLFGLLCGVVSQYKLGIRQVEKLIEEKKDKAYSMFKKDITMNLMFSSIISVVAAIVWPLILVILVFYVLFEYIKNKKKK